jgi:hypothetical protein
MVDVRIEFSKTLLYHIKALVYYELKINPETDQGSSMLFLSNCPFVDSFCMNIILHNSYKGLVRI